MTMETDMIDKVKVEYNGHEGIEEDDEAMDAVDDIKNVKSEIKLVVTTNKNSTNKREPLSLEDLLAKKKQLEEAEGKVRP